MASAYTNPTTYEEQKSWWSPELLKLTDRMLSYKQEKYDVNKAKADQFYNQLETVELRKEGDREYLENNLKMLNQQVIEAGGLGDLSVTGSFDALAGYYGQALDEKVTNGYYGTLAGKKIMSEAEKAKKDGKYNDVNLEYSLEKYTGWVNDGQVGSEYSGGNSYVPYTDIIEKATAAIDKIKPNGYVKWDSLGNFTYFEENGEEITEDQIVSRLNAVVLNDPNVQQQMRVNSWDKFRGFDDKAFTEHVSSIYDKQVGQYDNRINDLKYAKTKTKNEAGKTEIQAEIDRITKAKEKLISNDTEENILKNRKGLEMMLYENDFVNEMAGTFKYKSVKSKEFETNQGAMAVWKDNQESVRAKAKLDFDIEKDQRDARIKVMEAYQSAEEKEKGTGTAAAMRIGSAYGFSEGYLNSMIIGSPNTTPLSIKTPREQSDATREYLSANVYNSQKDLVSKEEGFKNLFFTEKGKDAFGLGNDKQMSKVLLDTNKWTQATFDEYVRAGMMQGNYSQFKERVVEYNDTKEKGYVWSYIKGKVDEEIDVIAKEPFEKFKISTSLDEKMDNAEKNPNKDISVLGGVSFQKNWFGEPSLLFSSFNYFINFNNGEYSLKKFHRVKSEGGFDALANTFANTSTTATTEVLKTTNKKEIYDFLKVNLKETKKVADQVYQKYFNDVYSLVTPQVIRGDDPANAPIVQQAYRQLSPDRIPTEFKEKTALKDKDGNVTGVDFSKINMRIDKGNGDVTFTAKDSNFTEGLGTFSGGVRENILMVEEATKTKRESSEFSNFYNKYPIEVPPISQSFIDSETGNPIDIKIEFKKSDGMFFPLLETKGLKDDFQYYVLPNGTSDINVAKSAAIIELQKYQ